MAYILWTVLKKFWNKNWNLIASSKQMQHQSRCNIVSFLFFKCMSWGKKKKTPHDCLYPVEKVLNTSFLFGRGGMISSECLAGYWCKSGSSNNLINRTIEFQNCSANEDCSGLCPKGHYCPQGVDLPLPCPEHTYRDTEGAETPDQCAPCPAGFYCPSGNDWQLLLLVTIKFNVYNWVTDKIIYLR